MRAFTEFRNLLVKASVVTPDEAAGLDQTSPEWRRYVALHVDDPTQVDRIVSSPELPDEIDHILTLATLNYSAQYVRAEFRSFDALMERLREAVEHADIRIRSESQSQATETPPPRQTKAPPSTTKRKSTSSPPIASKTKPTTKPPRRKKSSHRRRIPEMPSAEELQSGTADPLQYVPARTAQRDPAFATTPQNRYFQERGIAQTNYRNFRSGYPSAITAMAEGLDLNAAILFWLHRREQLQGIYGDDILPIAIQEQGEPPILVGAGAPIIPETFDNLPHEIDGMLLALDAERRIPAEDRSLYELIYNYGRRREQHPIVEGYRFKPEALPQVAEALVEHFADDEHPYTVDAMVQGLRIFFQDGVDVRFTPLWHAGREQIITPLLFPEGARIFSGKEELPTIPFVEYLAEQEGVLHTKAPVHGFMDFLHDVAKRRFTNFKGRIEDWERNGIPYGIITRLKNDRVVDYAAVDAIADALDIPRAQLYWEVYGKRLQKHFPIVEIEFSGEDGTERGTIGALQLPEQPAEPVRLVRALLDHAFRHTLYPAEEEASIYRALQFWHNHPTEYLPRDEITYARLADALLESFDLEPEPTRDEMIAAIKLTLNFMRVQEYLPIVIGETSAILPQGIAEARREGELLTPMDRDRAYAWPLDRTAAAQALWLRLRKTHETKPMELRDEAGKAFAIGAVVLPEGFSDFRFDVRRALIAFSGQMEHQSLPIATRNLLIALLQGKEQGFAEKTLRDLAARLATTVTTRPRARLREKMPDELRPRTLSAEEWYRALEIFTDVDGIASELPFWNPTANALHLPEWYRERYRAGTETFGTGLRTRLFDPRMMTQIVLFDFLSGRVVVQTERAIQLHGAAALLAELGKLFTAMPDAVNRDVLLRLLETIAADPAQYGVDEETLVVTLVHALWTIDRSDDATGRHRLRLLLEDRAYANLTPAQLAARFSEKTVWTRSNVLSKLTRRIPETAPIVRNERSSFVTHLYSAGDTLDELDNRRMDGEPLATTLLQGRKAIPIRTAADLQRFEGIDQTNYRFLFTAEGGLGLALPRNFELLRATEDLRADGIVRFSLERKRILVEGSPEEIVEEELVPLFRTLGFDARIGTRLLYDPVVDEDPEEDPEGGSAAPASGGSSTPAGGAQGSGGARGMSRFAGFADDAPETTTKTMEASTTWFLLGADDSAEETFGQRGYAIEVLGAPTSVLSTPLTGRAAPPTAR